MPTYPTTPRAARRLAKRLYTGLAMGHLPEVSNDLLSVLDHLQELSARRPRRGGSKNQDRWNKAIGDCDKGPIKDLVDVLPNFRINVNAELARTKDEEKVEGLLTVLSIISVVLELVKLLKQLRRSQTYGHSKG